MCEKWNAEGEEMSNKELKELKELKTIGDEELRSKEVRR